VLHCLPHAQLKPGPYGYPQAPVRHPANAERAAASRGLKAFVLMR
jgi:hypothetical protein